MWDRRRSIKKRISKRKRKKLGQPISSEHWYYAATHGEPYDLEWPASIGSGPGKKTHPLFRREVFLFQMLVSACLVLLTAILFRMESPALEPVRREVGEIMEREFRFAAVGDWYEKTFGKPLALFPVLSDRGDGKHSYALPADARIVEGFDVDNQGVTIRTEKGAAVEAIEDGRVTFAGVKDRLGKTVIVQHSDHSESWYARLSEIRVKVYDSISAGEKLGLVSPTEDGDYGQFYFAFKRDEKFVDPIQVISFE
jgi:Peptidase family M23.